jgi:PST family polysaccharide transporter
MNSKKSYSQILKSSSLVGGAQLIRMAIGVVSTKFAALFIGPAGVGLLGAYQSISQLGIQFSGLGINQSGVREIAVAEGSGDQEAVCRAAAVLRRMCWLTGIAGTVGMFVLAEPISRLTFGDTEYASELLVLSVVVLITSVSQGQLALLQGLRRIADLVRAQIIGALAGAIGSIILYVSLGIKGIAFAVLATAVFNLSASWYAAQKLSVKAARISWLETFVGAKELLSLGTAFMLTGLATVATAYAARTIVVRSMGAESLGMYEAAYAISGYVLNFVLGAMSADFYPRLAGASSDHEEMVRIVNEQTEIGLLLAAPVVTALLALAPLIINLLYSAEFDAAVGLLRWFVMGCFLRVISWPMGFVQMAKGAKFWFVFSQLFSNIFHITFILIGMAWFGLEGAAAAFFAMYVLYVFGIRFIAGKLIGFSWSKDAVSLILLQLSFVGIVFTATLFCSNILSMSIGTVMSLFMGIYCLRQLLMRLDKNHKLNRFAQRYFYNFKIFLHV